MEPDDESQSSIYTSRTLSPDEIDAIDKALDTLDIAASVTDEPAVIAPERRKLIDDAKKRLHDDAKANGFKAQARRKIDEHRREEGREPYNDRRRREYADKVRADTGAFPRAYMKGAGPEHRKAQVAGATAKWRAKRTPEQIAEDKRKKAEAEKRRRARLKAEAQAEAEAQRPEHYGKF